MFENWSQVTQSLLKLEIKQEFKITEICYFNTMNYQSGLIVCIRAVV